MEKTADENNRSRTSISQRLHEQLGRIIAETQPGDRLPSEPQLAVQLGVSRATLREAMRTYETQGMIRRRQGSGTYVSHPSRIIESGLEVLESIETLADRIGLQVKMGALNIKTRLANEEERQGLGLPAGGDVISISRVILAEERPVAFLVDTLPCNILTEEDLREDFTGSVLDLLLKRGDPPLEISRSEVNATTAEGEVARTMGVQRGDVLLRFVAYLYATDGRIVDYSHSYFLPGYFRFHVVRRVG
jgi:GntR family transcriptional regulator